MYKIRSGNNHDITYIKKLVKELAIFEKEPNAVTATKEDYEFQFKSGLFSFNVATYNDKIIGMALYYDTFSTWKGKMTYLEDLIVTETHRNNGVGQLLFNSVMQDAKINGSKLLKWQILDWNVDALRFYDKYDATIEKDWFNGKIVF